MSVEFSIVIAHRGPLLGLWATIESCVTELGARNDYEFIVVVNGKADGLEEITFREAWASSGLLGHWAHSDEPLSPPSARNLGAEKARGKYLFFFDDHVLPCRGYFDYALETLARADVDMLFGTTIRYTKLPQMMECHHVLTLEKTFWGIKSTTPRDLENAYPIASGDHGGFAIKTSVWREVGGYWDGFVAWGGEEPYLNFKLNLFGKRLWQHPKMMLKHFLAPRPYPTSQSHDVKLNAMMCANIIGGPRWLEKVASSLYNTFVPVKGPYRSIDSLKAEAQERSQQHADWLKQNRKQSLDDFLAACPNAGIAH